MGRWHWARAWRYLARPTAQKGEVIKSGYMPTDYNTPSDSCFLLVSFSTLISSLRIQSLEG